jgi:hypothetical protein
MKSEMVELPRKLKLFTFQGRPDEKENHKESNKKFRNWEPVKNSNKKGNISFVIKSVLHIG